MPASKFLAVRRHFIPGSLILSTPYNHIWTWHTDGQAELRYEVYQYNNNNRDDIYGAVIHHGKAIVRVHLVIHHLMNADSTPRWPPTLRPSQPTWTASPPERNGSYRPHPPSPFIITQPESWYLFYRPAEGGRLSQPEHCSKGVQPVPKAVYRSGCHDKHNRLRWDSNLGPLTPQSGMLPLDHCDTAV